MGFASLQHMRNRRSRCERPASRSRVRPQGLATLSTLCSLRRLAGFVSHRQRSWDSPFGAFSSRKATSGFPPVAPTYRLAAAQECPKAFLYESQPSVSGLCSFRESLAIKPVISGFIAGCSLGFCSSRAYGQEAWLGISPELLSRTWRRGQRPRNLHHRVSINSCLDQPSRNGKPKRTAEQPS